ncbi:MAG: hypothetical protein ACW98D_07325 [Promethearchaeota archaeon]|jgi:hypothetical protein
MKNRSKLISKIVVTVLVLFIIGYSFANPGDFVDFEGSTHGGCHGTNPVSSTGYIELNSSEGSNLLPSQLFTLSAQVLNFTEGASQSVSVGFAQGNPGRGDNKKFSFNQPQFNGISIDGSGNSGILSFQVTTPSTFGNYTLVIDVLEGSGPDMFEWTTGSINLLIGFPSIPGAPILENLSSTSSVLELGDTQSIQIDAYDNETSVNQVLIEFNGANHSLIHSVSNTYVYQNWTPSNIGQKSYIIYAYDTENKLSGAGGSFTVQDTVLPIYTNYFKSSDTVEAGETVNIQISATDIAGIKGVSIEFESIVHLMTYIGNDTWSYELRAPDQGGILDYTIKIEDNSGNTETIDDSFQITGGISSGPSGLNDLMILGFGSFTAVLSISFIAIALKRRKHFY